MILDSKLIDLIRVRGAIHLEVFVRCMFIVATGLMMAGCFLDSSGLAGVGGTGGTAGSGGSVGGQGGTGGDAGTGGSVGGQGGTGGDAGTGGSVGGQGGTGGDAGTGGSVGGQGGTGGDAGTGGTGGTGGSGGGCGQFGTVVFDSVMPCYKHGLYRSGDFLPEPDSSSDTAACQTGTCANTPMAGDLEILWVQETLSNGLFTSVSQPVSYAAHCMSYTAASPPTLTQLKADLALPTGWFIPGVSKVGDSYTLIAVSCTPGQSALYEIIY